jgi:hypothetical protein
MNVMKFQMNISNLQDQNIPALEQQMIDELLKNKIFEKKYLFSKTNKKTCM